MCFLPLFSYICKRTMQKCFILTLVLCFFIEHARCKGPIARTTNGYILGRESITPNGKSFFMFQGIPYAQPPLGNLRFADPQEHEDWKDLKECTNSNIACFQINEETTEYETEDCLILNVYTPKLDFKESNLPVMLYFHGGGFYFGNSFYDSYGPEFFMDRDVVVVLANYRLGAFGFLSTEDDVITGNFGLKDQQFAMKWVQKNIRAFNGDPEKVTIFGESAGSASVGYQLLNKKNEGLFRGAIMSSGSPLNLWAFQRNPKKVAYLTAKFVNNSESINSSQQLVNFLRSVPALELMKASYNLKHTDPFGYKQWLDGYYYSPAVEYNTSNAFLLSYPYDSLENGDFVHVPIVIGINSEEQLYMIGDGDNFVKLLKSYDTNNELMVSAHLSIDDVEQKKVVGKLIHEIYCDGNEKLENRLNKGIRFFSDQKMNLGILRQAYFTSNFADVYLYQFSYRGLMGNKTYHVEGAEKVTHAEDNNYLWRRNLLDANNTDLSIFPQSDLIVQSRLLDIYTNFAKYLNPTNAKHSSIHNILWPKVNTKDSRGVTYLDIGNEFQLKTKLKEDTFSKWDDLYRTYAKFPHTGY